MTCYCKVLGPNFESLTVRALGLATLKKRPNDGQSTLGSYSSDLGLLYHNIFPCPSAPPGVCFKAPCSERSDRPQNRAAFQLHGDSWGTETGEYESSLTATPGRDRWPHRGRRENSRTLPFWFPGNPRAAEMRSGLWPIGSLRARRIEKNLPLTLGPWEDIW